MLNVRCFQLLRYPHTEDMLGSAKPQRIRFIDDKTRTKPPLFDSDIPLGVAD